MHTPRLRSLALAVGLAGPAALAGCSDRMLDVGATNYVFGGAPAADAPTPIRGLSPTPRDYPKLGSVPPRPTNVSTVEQHEAELARLAKARAANRETADVLRRAGDGPTPLEVPPPPNLTPGKSR